MDHTPFMESNLVLAPAPGTEDHVTDLHVFTDGREVISRWEPSEEDRKKIADGAPIWLRVLSGGTSYPVCVTVDDPFLPNGQKAS